VYFNISSFESKPEQYSSKKQQEDNE